MGRAQEENIKRQLAHINTFKIGGIYQSVFDDNLLVKCTSLDGPRAICFTGDVIRGEGESIPVGSKEAGWVYDSFKEWFKD